MRNLLFLSICALTTTVFSANYYVSNAGNDSNNGGSPSTAWKTLANVNTQSFLPGDSILFERGGIWNESLVITSSGSSAGQITYSAYGTGDKPVFNGISEVSGWKTSGNWTNMGSNVWRTNTWGQTVGRIWINGEERERSQASAEGVGVTATYPWQKIDSKLYLYSTSNPASTYSSLKMTSDGSAITATNKNYITLNNIEIKGWLEPTISGCSNWVIEYCDFYYNWRGLRIRGDQGTYSNNGVIRYCDFDSKYPFAIRIDVEGTQQSTYWGAHNGLIMSGGGFVNWDIFDNHFKGFGYTIWSVTNHEANGLMTAGLKFHDNYTDQTGQIYGRAFGGHIRPAQTDINNPIEIYNNYFKNQAVHSQIGVPYLKIYNNIFDGCTGEYGWDNETSAAIVFAGYLGRPSLKMKIYNNVFTRTGRFAVFLSASSWDEPAVDNEFVNNIFYNNSIGEVKRGVHMYLGYWNDTLINTLIIKNNLFYSASANSSIYAYTAHWSPENFNGIAENDPATNPHNYVTSGNFHGDPLFVDPLNGDFRLQANSPAIGAGLTPISAADAAGNAWNDSPSIGPYEYSSSTRVSESSPSQTSPAFKFSTTRGAIVIEPGQSRRASIKVALYDARGRRVSLLHGAGEKSLRLETKAFTPGVYTMQILIDGRSYTRRIAVGGQRQMRM